MLISASPLSARTRACAGSSRFATPSIGWSERRNTRRPFCSFSAARIERLDRLDARAHVVALRLGGQHQQHRRARLEQVAVLLQAFLEDHRLVVAGRVGEFQNAHLVAGLGAPLRARHHGAGDAARGRALLHRAAERGPGLHASAARALPRSRRADGRRGRSRSRRTRAAAARRAATARPPAAAAARASTRRRTARSVPSRRPRGGAAPPPGSTSTPACTRARLRSSASNAPAAREAFQHALVDRARIDPAREVREVAERPVAARLDDRLDRLPADALQRRQRVVDRVALDVERRRPND